MHRPHRVTHLLAALCCAVGNLSAAPTERFASFAGFALWSTTLAQVQQVLGPARVAKTGDAAGSDTSICYRAQGAFVVFYSGEMGGGVQLEGVTISIEPPTHVHCTDSKNPSRLKTLEIDGLKLGMTRAQFAAIAPPGVTWNKREGSASRIASTGEQSARTAVTSIGAEFKAGRAVMFYVSRHEEE